MKHIVVKVILVAFIAVSAISATRAYFIDQSEATQASFRSGQLEIRVNDGTAISGTTFTAITPTQQQTSVLFHIQNYGQPTFPGTSTVAAKKLLMSITEIDDHNSGLKQVLKVKVSVGRGNGVADHQIYDGLLKDVQNLDLLSPTWTSLEVGETQDLQYVVYLPTPEESAPSYMGQTMSWNIMIEGRTN